MVLRFDSRILFLLYNLSHLDDEFLFQGDLVFELWEDTAPKTVANFKALVNSGFYDGTAFHRFGSFSGKEPPS